MKIRKCNRCDNVVQKSEVEEYAFTCNCCDEGLYTIETYVEENGD